MAADRRITLDHFRAFIAVVECGSFVAAAQRMGRTQSALTHQVRSLEQLLGERLLNRSQGHLSGLTAQGMHLLPHAQRVIGAVASACRAANKPLLSGRVRVGVMDDFGMDGLAALTARFKAIHADAEVSVTADLSSRLEALLARGEIDLALTKQIALPGQAPLADALRIEPLQWVTGAAFAWPGPPQPLPLVVFHDGCIYRQQVLEHLHRLGLDWYIAYAGSSYHNVRAAIEAGLGLSLMPQGQLSAACEARTSLPGGIALPAPGFGELLLRTASGPASPVVQAFRQELARALAQTSPVAAP